MRILSFTYFLMVLVYFVSMPTQAEDVCIKWVAKLVSVDGRVDVQTRTSTIWEPVTIGQLFCQGDLIRAGKRSRATFRLQNDAIISLDQQTTLNILSAEKKEESWWLELLEGSIFARSREPKSLHIDTPFINAVHKGTEFLVTVKPHSAEISVFDGSVSAENKAGKVLIESGYIGIAQEHQAPVVQALRIKPQDAVQWTLYYPSIIAQQGDYSRAFEGLANIPEIQRNSHYWSNLASLLLTVGRVDEAEQALAHISGASDGNALAAIIAVTKNQQSQALELAKQAVALDASSASAQIALSYAYQSLFKIQDAQTAAEQATRLVPDNALAWSRLAELQLSNGERDAALLSATKAQKLNPTLAHTQMTLGFAKLAQVEIKAAQADFERAIKLNSSEPLARLGLGLAKIRQGDLEDGTRELETAVNLDPNNAIIRSYLGKAYYEQRNKDYAGTEFKIAKAMDPKDPTPWFYDAILKQTTNRPVEALKDMQTAIELNDNRGVYRSRLLLDKDLAARGAAQGRIYNDIGFQRLGLVESWKSIAVDAGDYSGHRLLADSYSNLPRHEISRVSELLQSQLLQSINIAPIQPSLAESNLSILAGSGPTTNSFNEFNPLFTRNYLTMQSSGVVGGHDTLGDEVVLAGLADKTSYSLGQMHYHTDGFRQNNDLTQRLYNVFVQHEITPNLNIQAEYRRKETETGDLVLKFDPTKFSSRTRREVFQDTARIGSHYSLSPESDIIVSGIYTKRDSAVRQPNSAGEISSDSYQIESQYLFHRDWLSLRTGGGFSTKDSNNNIQFKGRVVSRSQAQEDYGNIYAYGTVNFPQSVAWTLGLSSDFINSLDRTINKVNPKFGVQWALTDRTSIRAAYFQSTKRALVVNQTLEPTQIGGFNQFFDDFNATDAKRFGIGIDSRLSKTTSVGAEISRRLLKVPGIVGENNDRILDGRSETLARAYWYWIPYKNWAFSTDFEYEKFHRNASDKSVTDDGNPLTVETVSIPLSARYFDTSGFFGTLNGTFVHQNVFTLAASDPHGTDTFFLVDAKIGYRLPKRWGILSIEAKNLFDKKFFYQDRNIQTSGETGATEAPSLSPDRIVLFKATLAFN